MNRHPNRWISLITIAVTAAWWIVSRVQGHSAGLATQIFWVGILGLFIPPRWLEPPVRRRVFREGGEIVFLWKRDWQQRLEIDRIASYRFDAVWVVEFAMKDGEVNRIRLPAVDLKPSIIAIMTSAGVPFADLR